MAKAQRLKVFEAAFGFHDSVVAAPSQAAALRAWGTRQNLFAEGQARIATDEAAVKAALAHPEIPLRRAIGSKDAFALAPTGLPTLPDAPKPPKGKAAGKSKPTPAKPVADRRVLDAAEEVLHALDADREREEADLRRRQEDLDAEIAKSQETYAQARKAASAVLAKARQAYRAAGGTGH